MAEPSNTIASPAAENSPKPGDTAQAGTADEGKESGGVSEGNQADGRIHHTITCVVQLTVYHS